MMPGGGSQSNGVFGLPQNPFPQFGATSPNQSQTRAGFGPQTSGVFPSRPVGSAPQVSGPFFSRPNPVGSTPQTSGVFPSRPNGFGPQINPNSGQMNPFFPSPFQNEQNTQGLSQAQIGMGTMFNNGTMTFAPPTSPVQLSPMTAAFLGMGPPQLNAHQNSQGNPPGPFGTPGQGGQGFGPFPAGFSGQTKPIMAPPSAPAQPFPMDFMGSANPVARQRPFSFGY